MSPNPSDPDRGLEPDGRADDESDGHAEPNGIEAASDLTDEPLPEPGAMPEPEPVLATDPATDASAQDAPAADASASGDTAADGNAGTGDEAADRAAGGASDEAAARSGGAGGGTEAGQGEEAKGRRKDGKRRRRFPDGIAASMRARIRSLPRSRAFWVFATILLVLAASWRRCGIRGCPSVARLASYQPGGASILLDRNGKKFADLGPVDHSVVEIASLPDYVAGSFVAVEDKRFYRHRGVDWRRVFGAALANVRAGRTVQGSSTISMQLTRNLFPDRISAADRTMRRKLLEVRVARDIEKHFTKPEILELYLNHIYFGAGAYGIEAASKQYFGKSAKDLTLEQAAVLAALPKAPSTYDPRRNPERSRKRRDLVLVLMESQGYITADQREKAAASRIRVANSRTTREGGPTAAYFVQVVRDMLEEKLGEDLYSRPLRIHTTIDLRAQHAAEEELEAQLRRVESGTYGTFSGPRIAQFKTGGSTDYLQGAAVVLDNSTGDVLALVGGRDARHSSFNRAVAARRQAGSSFKPFVYAAAISRGWSPAQILDDSPYRLISDGRPWEPNNYDGEFMGPITLRDALVFSRNVPTIRLADDVGEKNVVKLARSAGIRAEMRETPMIALGIAEVSPLELTSAYTSFSGQGRMAEPRFVLRVDDPDGKVLWQPDVRQHDVMDRGVAYVMTDMMRDAVDRGTGRNVRHAGYRGMAAGKTGTTNDGADNWFVGYTPRVTGGIWIGFDKPHEIAPRASGAVAAYAWGRMMSRISSWADGNPWSAPERVVEVSIDPLTGLALEDGCRPREGDARNEVFLKERAPETSCPERIADASRGSWLDRALAWAVGLIDSIQEKRQVRLAGNDDDSERRASAERVEVREPEQRQDRADNDRWNRGDDWNREDDFMRRDEWRRRNESDWAEDVSGLLREAIEQRQQQEEQVIGWLGELASQLRNRLEDRDADNINEVVESAMRAVQEARRDARRQERRRIEQWLERVREESSNGRLSERQRLQIEREARRALGELRGLDREIIIGRARDH